MNPHRDVRNERTGHDLALTHGRRELRYALHMPIGMAHDYAVALAGEFFVTSYTLNEATHARIPRALREAIEAEKRYLTDADDCEGND
jgi:hypothetical protein